MALAFLLSLALGFGKSVPARIAQTGPLEPVVVLHGILFASWFVIFFVQATLIAAGRVALHRALGIAAAALAAVIVVDGPLMAVAAARRGHLGPDGLAFMLVMIVDVVGFAVFVGAALAFRHRAEAHKRLMLLGTTSLLAPAIFRWPFVAGHQALIPVVLLGFLAAAPVRDLLSRQRINPVSLWGGLLLFLSGPARFAIAHTDAWHRIAVWLVG